MSKKNKKGNKQQAQQQQFRAHQAAGHSQQVQCTCGHQPHDRNCPAAHFHHQQ